EEAEGVLEAFLVGLARRARAAEAPLADDRGPVAGIPQRHRHRDVVVAQGNLAVAPNRRMARVKSRHQRRARRRADGATGVVLREAHAVFRKPIEGWGLEA